MNKWHGIARGENSMAVSGFSCGKALVGPGS